MMRAVLSNLSTLPRTAWCDFDIKLPLLVRAAGSGKLPLSLNFLPDNGNGEILRAFLKEPVGSESVIYSVEAMFTGSGTIKGLSGQGKTLKVSIAFDDEQVGLKQLLVA